MGYQGGRSSFRRILMRGGALLGAGTGAGSVLGSELDGLAIDFTDMSMVIRDRTTPSNQFSGDPNSKLTYSSPSTKWVLGSNGLYSSGTTLRTEYNSSGTALGVRLEEARTQVCVQNRDLTNAAWVKTRATAAKTATGIDGVSNSASTLTASSSNGVALQNITLASSARSGSVFLKRRTGTGAVTIAIGETTGSEVVTNGGFSTGANWTKGGTGTEDFSANTFAFTGASGLTLTNSSTLTVGKLYRYSYQITTVVTGGGFFQLVLGGVATGGVTAVGTYTGVVCPTTTTIIAQAFGDGAVDNISILEVAETTVDLSSGGWVRGEILNKTITNPCVAIKLATSGDAVDVDFCQNENGAFATSPIEHTGAVGTTVTRAADNVSIATTLFPYNQPTGTVFVEFNHPAFLTGSRMVNLSGGGAASRVVDLYAVATPAIQMYDGTTTLANQNFSLGVNTKVAGAYQTASYAISISGNAAVTSASAAVNTATTLQIGQLGSGSNAANSYIRKIMYLPRRMSNAELATVTT